MIVQNTQTLLPFADALASGQAELLEARLGWLQVRAGDVLTRRGLFWVSASGQMVPGWVVRLHWGTAFVPVGYQPPSIRTLLERRTAFLRCRRARA